MCRPAHRLVILFGSRLFTLIRSELDLDSENRVWTIWLPSLKLRVIVVLSMLATDPSTKRQIEIGEIAIFVAVFPVTISTGGLNSTVSLKSI